MIEGIAPSIIFIFTKIDLDIGTLYLLKVTRGVNINSKVKKPIVNNSVPKGIGSNLKVIPVFSVIESIIQLNTLIFS